MVVTRGWRTLGPKEGPGRDGKRGGAAEGVAVAVGGGLGVSVGQIVLIHRKTMRNHTNRSMGDCGRATVQISNCNYKPFNRWRWTVTYE